MSLKFPFFNKKLFCKKVTDESDNNKTVIKVEKVLLDTSKDIMVKIEDIKSAKIYRI